MINAADIRFDEDKIVVSGHIGFMNASLLFKQVKLRLNDYANITIDFANVTSSNSACLAFLIECIKHARLLNKPISFQHISDEILSIANVSGLDGLIKS